MRIGVFVSPTTVAATVDEVRTLHDEGFGAAWMPQIFGIDAITALAVVGQAVPDIRLGTAVVPTYPRHPTSLAIQARTTQQASGGRFTLGIGLSHQIVIETMLGMTWGEVRHLREYLSILVPLLNEGSVSFEGETLTAKIGLDVPCDPVPVLVAALGPKMLALAGKMTQGTVTWMTGAATIADHVVPSITRAAGEAERTAPEVVVALPTAVTDDPAAARELAASTFSIYGHLPSYRAMLDREGADGPADVAIIGSAEEVKDRIGRIGEAGATEFVAVPFTERDATLATVADLR